MVLRRARGYTPALLPGIPGQQVLACSAQQKKYAVLTKDGLAMLSQHFGDLENYETLEFFEQTLNRMKRLFQVAPRVVAHDLHPGYLSTHDLRKVFAERISAMQHHHALCTSRG